MNPDFVRLPPTRSLNTPLLTGSSVIRSRGEMGDAYRVCFNRQTREGVPALFITAGAAF